MKNKLLLILISLFLFSCICPSVSGEESMTIEANTFTDDLKREVTIPTSLTSIVTLAPSLTEMIYFLEAEDLLTAIDINSDFPSSVADLPHVTGWDTSINFEELTALDPDLILASEMTTLEQISRMEDLGLNVYCIKNPADFPELFETILIVGDIIGKTSEAETLVAELEDRTAEIESLIRSEGAHV